MAITNGGRIFSTPILFAKRGTHICYVAQPPTPTLAWMSPHSISRCSSQPLQQRKKSQSLNTVRRRNVNDQRPQYCMQYDQAYRRSHRPAREGQSSPGPVQGFRSVLVPQARLHILFAQKRPAAHDFQCAHRKHSQKRA